MSTQSIPVQVFEKLLKLIQRALNYSNVIDPTNGQKYLNDSVNART